MNDLRFAPGFRLILLPLAIAVLISLGIQPAFAHARLVKSNPADKAKLEEAPKQIELWFNELLDKGFHSVAVYPESEVNSKDRTSLTKGDVKVDGKDSTRLTVELKTLKPGKYVVDYRVLSRDGHSAPGRLTFEVLPAKPAAESK